MGTFKNNANPNIKEILSYQESKTSPVIVNMLTLKSFIYLNKGIDGIRIVRGDGQPYDEITPFPKLLTVTINDMLINSLSLADASRSIPGYGYLSIFSTFSHVQLLRIEFNKPNEESNLFYLSKLFYSYT
jgi:hypothetical protein